MIKESITHIVHFAAETHVDKSFKDPIPFLHTNAIGTTTLLEASRYYVMKDNNKLKSYIHMSTDEIYGENNNNNSFDESSVPQPTNPYAASKTSAEYMTRMYYKVFNNTYYCKRKQYL